ncbi:MAG: hypothetical protein IIB69_03975 [Proteobacteria bacterium]|nr:hypothetical protein [Pseudomonadota bacterium]MCH8177561.1 hypothetical protein [Pseudomonadota bacterium]
MLHIALHLVILWLVAILFFPKTAWKTGLVLMSTMLVDLDHLLANPLYDPNRCSIGFHPLHQFIPIGIYGLMLLHHKTRIVGLGLVIHMLLDLSDCMVMGQLP